MTPQKLRTRELLTRALPFLGPEGVEAVSAYLVGDRSFSLWRTTWMVDGALLEERAGSLLHWACYAPGGKWERMDQDALEECLKLYEHDSSPTTP